MILKLVHGYPCAARMAGEARAGRVVVRLRALSFVTDLSPALGIKLLVSVLTPKMRGGAASKSFMTSTDAKSINHEIDGTITPSARFFR